MTLAAENIALKAENARLRDALETVKDFLQIGNASRAFHVAYDAFHQPTPTTPATDKAQAVIDAAGALVDWPWFENVAPEEVALSTAVKAYRAGGAS